MFDRTGTTTVGDIVAKDFRTAAVLENFGIDFCCGGRQLLADACRRAEADPAVVARALDSLPDAPGAADDVTTWPVDRLIEHIVDTHHAFVRRAMPVIGRHLAKLHEVHGARHPELARVEQAFAHVAGELAQHMVKEEQVLFPYVRELAASTEESCGTIPCPFGTVENPIDMMEREHQDAADALRLIRVWTGGYAVPADGCTTYAVCMRELDDFERDLHRHVHLENNVLFPRAIAIERGSHP